MTGKWLRIFRDPVAGSKSLDKWPVLNKSTPNFNSRYQKWSSKPSFASRVPSGDLYIFRFNISQTYVFTNKTYNSISIPLNYLNAETSETVYTLKKNDSNGAAISNEIATFSIIYDTEEEFVSRSCGFKVIFKNVGFSSSTNSWITAFTPSTIINLDDQSEAHVQIFH